MQEPQDNETRNVFVEAHMHHNEKKDGGTGEHVGVGEHVRHAGSRGVHSMLGALIEFQKFMLRGNVIDLAVGIVIGTAFTALVSSFVKDFITPLIGLIGIPHLNSYTFGPKSNPFQLGDFLNGVISFVIVAAVIFFLVVRPVDTLQKRLTRQKKAAPPTTYECPFCFGTISLKATRCAHCTSQLPPRAEQGTA